MKDKFGGVFVVEFVGIKPKIYSMKKNMVVENVIQPNE